MQEPRKRKTTKAMEKSGDYRLSWGWEHEASRIFESQGNVPDEVFWKHLNILYNARYGKHDDSWDPKTALEYFGYKINERAQYAFTYGEVVHGTISTDFDGMGARPEWAPVNRSAQGHLIVEVEAALRKLVELIKSSNAQDGAVMQDVERKHLLVTIDAVQREIADAPYVNKSALRGLSSWVGKLAVKAGEAYLSSAFKDAFAFAAEKLEQLAAIIAQGGPKLPW
jgi:hypothetical protein